jgi:hypothetical protein
MSFKDAFLLADALPRLVVNLMFRKEFPKAKHFINESFKIYESLVISDKSIRSSDPYAFMIWVRICLQIDYITLRQANDWILSEYHNSKILARVLGNTILSICFPVITEFGEKTPRAPFTEGEQNMLLSLVDQLDMELLQCGYKTVNRTVSGISVMDFVDNVLDSLWNWIIGDYAKTFRSLEQCVFQVLLVNNVDTDPVVLNLATTIAIQLAGIKIFEAKTNPNPEVLKCITMSEVLLKFSQQAKRAFGVYLDEWNRMSLENFVEIYRNIENNWRDSSSILGVR